MDINNRGEWKRPIKLSKRIVEYVTKLQLFDAWNDIPTKAWVYYQDYDHENMMSKPLKIKQRKNGTYYVQFEGYRYDIDITVGNQYQSIDHIKDAKMRKNMVEKALLSQ